MVPPPAVASCPQLFAFLGVATTNIIASNSLKAGGLDAKTL